MSFPNCLPANSYEGTIDGITIRWGPNAIGKLPLDAGSFQVDPVALKGATEHVAHACGKRVGRTGVKILYVYPGVNIER
ncbi:hypothetical protein N7497_005195 [Penicillium chrysogenum]|jgi:hypothetical protein|uniref:Uncharacterized protein n=1 Tax=Penicillium chrysogenum TaxID=5076 RepID=A0ABQ8WPJ3_PENCH|nr:hypothetical protein N7505_003137 [Penicillium chrysogenum]KAJ5285084.1 hypothetical protein N7524_000390 [Penicillium chrysogenum]KAJ6156310.1 hypothetical protein N7497_005195 [Penicillium chrysogenum]